jgi:CRISPR-associated protein Csh1
MLNLLYKFGVRLEQSDDLDKILIDPPREEKDVKYYNVGILIDLDENKVILDPDYLSEYDGINSIKRFLATKSIIGNQRKFYLTVDGKGYGKLIGTLYNDKGTCDLKIRLLQHDNLFIDSLIYKVADKIEQNFNYFTYENRYPPVTVKDRVLEFNKDSFLTNIQPLIGLRAKNKVMLYYLLIKCTELGINQPTLAASLDGYIDLAKREHLPQDSSTEGFCYVSGKVEPNLLPGEDFPANNLSKIFVTTTINYASEFFRDNFAKNYSLSKKSKEIIEYASDYCMKNLRINIAGIPHLLIPEFPFGFDEDVEYAVEKFKKVNDIVFNNQEFSFAIDYFNAANELEDKVFWFNYFGFLSDKASFKLVNRIKDVNSRNLIKISKMFNNNSLKIHSNKPKFAYNLRTIYNIIPVKSNDTPKNPALDLIDSILENKPIDINIIFYHFKELALYYFLDRGKIKGNYKNIYPVSDPKYFDFNIRDAVENYLVLIKTLLDNNQLINHNFKSEGLMEENQNTQFSNKEEALFALHGYTDQQKAMFYLGRMVSIIGYAQHAKGHQQKPILQKINFNGMGLREIVKLRSELYEKARQYQKDLTFLDSKFAQFFNYNNWNMSNFEALFFLLNGYSFYVSQKDSNNNENQQTSNNTEE